jgi:hypothetical protein
MQTINHSQNLNIENNYSDQVKNNHQIIYRPATKNDIQNIRALMNSVWLPPKTFEYFLWLVFDSPIPAVIICAYCKDKMVGMFILHKRKLSNGAKYGWASGLLIDKDFRGKGIFSILGKMANAAFPDLDALFSIPNVSGKHALKRSLNLKTLGKVATLVLPDLNHIVKSEGTIFEPVTTETQFENLIQTDNEVIMFDHNPSYRLWRYGTHKMRNFSKVYLKSGEYIVTTIYKDPNAPVIYGDIVDVECPLDNIVKIEELIINAAWHLKSKGAQQITIWANPHSKIYASACNMGFKQDHQNRFFCGKVINPEYDYLYDFTRWHLIQSDAIR